MTLKDTARKSFKELREKFPAFNISQLLRNAGWDINGEWVCAECGRMIGKNLKGEKPFWHAAKHSESHKKVGEWADAL